MDGYVSIFKEIPVFRLGIDYTPLSIETFTNVLRKMIQAKRGIQVWLESQFDIMSMQIKFLVVQDKFLTLDKCEKIIKLDREIEYVFSSKEYYNQNSKVIASFYVEPCGIDDMKEDDYNSIIDIILPKEEEKQTVKTEKTLAALTCPCCGGAVNMKTMICDYCRSELIWK